jgi:hypothetical protein
MAKQLKKKEVVETVPQTEVLAASSEELKPKKKAKKVVKKRKTAKKPAVKKSTTALPADQTYKPINPDAYLVIDYPVEADIIKNGHYAIRIGASHNGYVEISFNKGEWNPCRYADGYWWFDWVYFTPGNYVLSARMIDPRGNKIIETPERKCKVC